MTELNTADFYRRRERQERDLAERAGDPMIRNIHLELAESYVELAERARRIGEDRARLGLRYAG